jgi:hypothetical protein
MEGEGNKIETGPSRKKKWLTYAGIGAFAFFLIKGLAWLIVPAVLVWFSTR